MPAIVIIIPARMASERFPGKMLADDTGTPLIVHTCLQARRAARADRLLVATDHARIRDAVADAGIDVVMTAATHTNGTSRLAEAADILRLAADDIIVNVQGDEPEIDPDLIDGAVDALGAAPMATVASPFAPGHDPADPNVVKVVTRRDGRALYFSRSLIPFPRRPGSARVLRHVGLYVYRRDFLRTYVTLPPAPLETAESLEQLRVLEHGFDIAVAVHPSAHQGIDTRAQYEAFVARRRRAGHERSDSSLPPAP